MGSLKVCHGILLFFLNDDCGVATGFREGSYGISMMFLWHSMIVLWDSYMAFPLGSHDVSMEFLWGVLKEFYGILRGFLSWFLCYFHVISLIFLLKFCGIPIGFPWYFDGVTLEFQMKVSWKHFKINGKYIAINWTKMESKLKSIWNQFETNSKSSWNQIGINWNQIEIKLESIDINWNQFKINSKSNWNQFEISSKSIQNQLKSIWNQFKINWNQFKINWNQLKSIQNRLKSI